MSIYRVVKLTSSTHLAQGADFQVRAVWKPRSVVLWDSQPCQQPTRDNTDSQIVPLLIPPSGITILLETVSDMARGSHPKPRGRL